MIQAIVPAAGRGERLGSKIEKPYVLLAGIPILVWTLRGLEAIKEIDSIVLVVSSRWKETVPRRIIVPYRLKKINAVVVGGATRMESVYAGLNSLKSETRWVVVHDAARPLVSSSEIRRLIRTAKKTGAACSGIVPKDTTKKVNSRGWVEQTLDRQRLRAVLTPQVFEKSTLVKAYSAAFKNGYHGTDEASLVEHAGARVKVINGDRENIKITTPEDLLLAEAILRKRTKGSGQRLASSVQRKL